MTLAPFNLNSYVVLICNYIPRVGDKVEESTNFKFDFLEANFLAGLLTEFNFLFIMSVPLTNGRVISDPAKQLVEKRIICEKRFGKINFEKYPFVKFSCLKINSGNSPGTITIT